MSNAKRNLRFLKRRHEKTGFDCDYLSKLSPEELEWMEREMRAYYDGADSDPVRKRECNHRRYMAKEADCMALDRAPTELLESSHDDLTPEAILLLRERILGASG